MAELEAAPPSHPAAASVSLVEEEGSSSVVAPCQNHRF